jgi:hypothetical protein
MSSHFKLCFGFIKIIYNSVKLIKHCSNSPVSARHTVKTCMLENLDSSCIPQHSVLFLMEMHYVYQNFKLFLSKILAPYFTQFSLQKLAPRVYLLRLTCKIFGNFIWCSVKQRTLYLSLVIRHYTVQVINSVTK